jgi:hypothetical protein
MAARMHLFHCQLQRYMCAHFLGGETCVRLARKAIVASARTVRSTISAEMASAIHKPILDIARPPERRP